MIGLVIAVTVTLTIGHHHPYRFYHYVKARYEDRADCLERGKKLAAQIRAIQPRHSTVEITLICAASPPRET